MLYKLNFLLYSYILTMNPFWFASLADQSGIIFSLWDYFWCIIVINPSNRNQSQQFPASIDFCCPIPADVTLENSQGIYVITWNSLCHTTYESFKHTVGGAQEIYGSKGSCCYLLALM